MNKTISLAASPQDYLPDSEREGLFALSLSVGATLELDGALHEFLSRCVNLLERRAGAIIAVSDNHSPVSFDVLLSMPPTVVTGNETQALSLNLQSIDFSDYSKNAHKLVKNNSDDLNYDLFVIPGFGILWLAGKPLTLSETFYRHFSQILTKLSASCHACLVHTKNQQHTRRLELATKAARIGTWEMDITTGRVQIDQRIQEMLGLEQKRTSVSLHEYFQVVHEDDKAYVGNHVSNYIAQAIDEPTEYYYRIRRSDGEIRKLAANATLLFDGDKPVKLVCVNHDVTEIELERTHSLYRSQLETLLVSLSVDLIKNNYNHLDQVVTSALGKVGGFVGADRAYRFVYDFSEDTCSNTHEWCADDIPSEMESLQDIPINAIRLWVTAHRAGLPFFISSVKELPPDHGLRQILEPQGIQSLVTIPLMHDECCVGFIGFDAVRQERLWTEVDLTLLKLLAELLINADIRVQHEALINDQNTALSNARDHAERLAQEADQANTAKSRFVARVSHEVRAPLHAILGLTEMLMAEAPAERVQQLTMTIRESGTALLHLINDILDFSKAESNDVVLAIADFKLIVLITTLERMFRPLAEKKQLSLSVVIEPDVCSDYRGDVLRIRQILTNFLSNAIKFTNAGEISLRVSRSRASEGQLCFAVSDTGPGIPPEDIGKLFIPFFQSASTESTTPGGTGLGLPIAKALAERMGGDIQVSSEPGAGAKFTLQVPLQPSTAETASQKHHRVSSSPDEVSGLNILVAEDNLVNIEIIKAYLKNSSATLVCVHNGQQACEAVLDSPNSFDLILMDCNMPVMNGFDAARAIRASERGRRHTPIIAVTAGALDQDKTDCLAAGMDEILVKPFGRTELLNTLQQCMKTTAGRS